MRPRPPRLAPTIGCRCSGGEVCYGCNQMRRYDSVTYTAPESLSPAAPVERGEPDKVWVALEGVVVCTHGREHMGLCLLCDDIE